MWEKLPYREAAGPELIGPACNFSTSHGILITSN
jgi:hypothetical protein